ncbi:hypothetical protein NDU88_004533 [Pleurodeles waltl]|uniref:Uncharacterized protein n=1 Tax=Pleurodeles waltl TaxID=8319 RepID=A0AAV7WSL8_PLEWA|nr:hypothetical protein NDU88_004533 [Pleurodeles waltl]
MERTQTAEHTVVQSQQEALLTAHSVPQKLMNETILVTEDGSLPAEGGLLETENPYAPLSSLPDPPDTRGSQ